MEENKHISLDMMRDTIDQVYGEPTRKMRQAPFLISISTPKNLDLCINYSLDGLTYSVIGLYTFVDVQKEGFVPSCYGAKAHNINIVKKKDAVRNAELVPSWQSIIFQQPRITYYFPFYMRLQPIRKFEESLVRTESAYAAESLPLRGVHHKIYFQIDQTTVQGLWQTVSLWYEQARQVGASFSWSIYSLFQSKRRHGGWLAT